MQLDPGTLFRIVKACRSSTAGNSAVGDLEIAVADIRGEGHVTAIFADEDRVVECRLVVDDTRTLSVKILNRDAAVVDPLISDGELRVFWIDEVTIAVGPGVGERSILFGRAGRDSTEVVAEFRDGSQVHASLGGTWISLWWHGFKRPLEVIGLDAKGRRVASVEAP